MRSSAAKYQQRNVAPRCRKSSENVTDAEARASTYREKFGETDNLFLTCFACQMQERFLRSVSTCQAMKCGNLIVVHQALKTHTGS